MIFCTNLSGDKSCTTLHCVGKYERDEVKPTIDVVKKLADVHDTTVNYLLVETDKADLFKDPVTLQRLAELDKMESTKKAIYYKYWMALLNPLNLKILLPCDV